MRLTRPLAVRVVAAISGAAWVWSWYTMYLEIHRWKHVPLVPVQPETADPGHHHPAPARPSAQGGLFVCSVAAPLVFVGTVTGGSDPHQDAGVRHGRGRKTDDTDTIALVGFWTGQLRTVARDETREMLWLLVDRRRRLGDDHTRMVCRLCWRSSRVGRRRTCPRRRPARSSPAFGRAKRRREPLRRQMRPVSWAHMATSTRFRAPSFRMRLARWALTVLGVM